MRFKGKLKFTRKQYEYDRQKVQDAVSKINKYRSFLKEESDFLDERACRSISTSIRGLRSYIKSIKQEKMFVTMTQKGISVTLPVPNNMHLKSYEYENMKDTLLNKIRQERELRRRLNYNEKRIDAEAYSVIDSVIHTCHGDILRMQENLLRRGKATKKKIPLNSENHVGVELEVFLPFIERQQLNAVFRKHGLSGYVRTMTDRTILAPPDYCGWEICILARESEIEQVVNQVCAVLAELKADVNDSCGLHVHFDMRSRDYKKVFNNLVRCQKFLYSMVPPDRSRNKYCKKQKYTNWFKADPTHYYGISKNSYTKHQTIEIRMHHGVLDAKKVNNWIKMLQKIVDYEDFFTTDIESITKLDKKLGYDDDIKDYIKTQKKAFEQSKVEKGKTKSA